MLVHPFTMRNTNAKSHRKLTVLSNEFPLLMYCIGPLDFHSRTEISFRLLRFCWHLPMAFRNDNNGDLGTMEKKEQKKL